MGAKIEDYAEEIIVEAPDKEDETEKLIQKKAEKLAKEMKNNNSGPMIGKVATNLASSSANLAKKEVGRNDPCPCGSGKKYKRCHGA